MMECIECKTNPVAHGSDYCVGCLKLLDKLGEKQCYSFSRHRRERCSQPRDHEGKHHNAEKTLYWI